MKHLEIEKIIEFAQLKELTPEAMELIKEVNAHIANCPKCLKKVELIVKIQERMDAKK